VLIFIVSVKDVWRTWLRPWQRNCSVRQLGSSRLRQQRNSKNSSWRAYQVLCPWHISCWSV